MRAHTTLDGTTGAKTPYSEQRGCAVWNYYRYLMATVAELTLERNGVNIWGVTQDMNSAIRNQDLLIQLCLQARLSSKMRQ